MNAGSFAGQPSLPRFVVEAIMSGCNYKSRLDAFYDGQLDAEQSRKMSEHLAGCGECSQELENLRDLSRSLSRVQFEPISQIELARLHRNLSRMEDRSLFRLGMGLSAVAASILVISMAWLTQGPASPTKTPIAITPDAKLPAWEQMAMGTDPDQFPAGVEAPGSVNSHETGVATGPESKFRFDGAKPSSDPGLDTANWMLESVKSETR